MGDPGTVRSEAVEDLAYLFRSRNRIQLLQRLAERSTSRRALGEVTGASRTTLGRILAEFEDRGWVERTTDGDFVATTTGKHVAGEVAPPVDSMVAIRQLGEAVTVLPTDEESIGLSHFSDATVIRPAPNAPPEVGGSHVDLLMDADQVYTLTYIGPPRRVREVAYERVADGQLGATHVLAGGLAEYLRGGEERARHWRKYLEAGARAYEYAGHVPCHLFVADETVHIGKPETDPSGLFVETTDEVVRDWAVDLIETYRAEAEPLQVDSFDV